MNAPEERTSDYVCQPCGVEYLTESQKSEVRLSTYFTSTCGLCGEEKGVTNIRNFNYLRKGVNMLQQTGGSDFVKVMKSIKFSSTNGENK